MKNSHPLRNRAVGLAGHRRWFGNRLSMDATAPRKPASPATDARLFAWLLAPQHTPRLVPVTARARAR
jgi:hypothetical protein